VDEDEDSEQLLEYLAWFLIGAMHGVWFLLSIGWTDGMGEFRNSWKQSIDVFSFLAH
jgi:hypothetical protein